MAYQRQIKCPGCGISVPDAPEDASYEELLCSQCHADWDKDQEWEFTVKLSGKGSKDQAWQEALDAFFQDPGEPHDAARV